METEEGQVYYKKWLAGEITRKMVRERSGCGLLARLFSKKTDDEEDQKMIEAALIAEHQAQGGERSRTNEDDCDLHGKSSGSVMQTTPEVTSGRLGCLEGDTEQGQGLAPECEVPSVTLAAQQGFELPGDSGVQGRWLDQGCAESQDLPNLHQGPGNDQLYRMFDHRRWA